MIKNVKIMKMKFIYVVLVALVGKPDDPFSSK